MKNLLFILFFLIFGNTAWSSTNCPGMMEAKVAKWDMTSNECIASARKNLQSAIDGQYSSLINLALPDSPDSDGLTKESLAALQSSYLPYTKALCSVKAESYGLQKNYKFRAAEICIVMEAQRHLKIIKNLSQ